MYKMFFREKLTYLLKLDDIDNVYKTFIIFISALKTTNYWPLAPPNWCYTLYIWSTIIFLYMSFFIGQCYNIYKSYTGENFLELLCENTSIAEVFVGIFKAIYMRNNIRKIQQLVEDMNNNLLFKARNLQQKLIVKKTRITTYVICGALYIPTSLAISMILLLPHLFGFKFEFNFPFFDIYLSPYYYFFAIYRVIFYFYGYIATVSYDAMAFSMMIYISCQIDLLQNELENLSVEDVDALETTETRLKPIYEHFHLCIQKYQAISNLYNRFSDIYNPIIFFVFLGASMTLCFTLYSLTLVKMNCALAFKRRLI